MGFEERLLKPAEVADLLRVSVKTIYQWAKTGTLPCVRLGAGRRRPRILDQAFSEETVTKTDTAGWGEPL